MRRYVGLIALLCCLAATRGTAQYPGIHIGDAVITCGAPGPGMPVIATMGVQDANLQPVNVNWMAPMYHHANWNVGAMGQVFGIALDGNGNIYTTATNVYPYKPPFGPGGSGAVYRIDAITGVVTIFSALPNLGHMALGNICWDPDHNPPGSTNGQFFVTNFEDGKIYRLNGSTGAIAEIYDPFNADDGTVGIAPRDERLWGIGYLHSESRLYFGRWREDMGSPSVPKSNEIHSIGILTGGATDGQFDVIGGTSLEITLPAFGTFDYSQPPSDIEFSQSGRMLVSERGWQLDNGTGTNDIAHTARLLEFVGSHLAWPLLSGNSFGVGITLFGVRGNSAGGNDYGYRSFDWNHNIPVGCDSNVWSSGNALHFSGHDGFTDYIYGEQRFPAIGGTPANSQLIDIDGDITGWTYGKNYIGDIDIYKNCDLVNQCDSVWETVVASNAAGCCWDVTLVNHYLGNFWRGVQFDILTPGVTFTSTSGPAPWATNPWSATSVMFYRTPPPTPNYIPLGSSAALHFCLNAGTTPSQSIRITWIGLNGATCVDTITVECKTPQPCGSLFGISLKCLTTPPAAPSYSFTFSVNNQSTTTTFNTANITSTTMGVSVMPTSVPLGVLPPMTISTPKNVTILGGSPGQRVCINFQLLDNQKRIACSFDTCITLPQCKGCCDTLHLTHTPPVVVHANDGTVVLSTSITITPTPITRVSATIVGATRAIRYNDAAVPEAPVAAVFRAATLGNQQPNTALGMGEVTWGTIAAGSTVQNVPLVLTIALPPVIIKTTDTVTIWTKVTYTDTLCRTCDSMLCQKVVRAGTILSSTDVISASTGVVPRFGTRGGDPPKTGDRRLQSFGSSGKLIHIDMSSETAGTLTIENPALAQGDDPNSAITIIGLEMEPEVGIELLTMQENGGNQQAAVVADRVGTFAQLQSSIGPGTQRTCSLTYENPDAYTAFVNYLTVIYTTPGNPVDRATIPVYARTPNGLGGDALAVDGTLSLTNVRTYGLRFDNGNSTGDAIARVEVTIADNVGDGDDIVAIGPGIDRLKMTLKSFETIEANPRSVLLAEEPAATAATELPLAPNGAVTPIYVTVCGGVDNDVTFEYTTFNDKDEVVSTGTVTADSPLRTGHSGVDDPSVPGVDVPVVDCVPNPTAQSVTFSFRLRRAEAPVRLTIVDAMGREVLRVIDGGALGAGPHEVTADVSKLPGGSYFYELRTATQVETRRMEIVR